MRTLAENWATARSGLYRYEVKVTIAGVEYGESSILSVSTSASLFADKPAAVGVCAAKEIDLKIVPNGVVPRMAEIIIWVRPVGESVSGDWLQKGVYYIDTRETDHNSGVLTIHGYDAMLKAEQQYIPTGVESGTWPRKMPEVVEDICYRIGVELDDRTTISDWDVQYTGDFTMREVLGYIAACHVGNWTITDAGKLRLVPLYSNILTIGYLADEYGNAITFGGVKILV